MKNPIDQVLWVNIEDVIPNSYNPNRQGKPNADLLIESIKQDGWTQPILVCPKNEKGKHVIIDGQHRWLSAAALNHQTVPIVILDRSFDGCIAATVRHNRARGAHGVADMAALIGLMKKEGRSTKEIQQAMGLSAIEFEKLDASEELFLNFMSQHDKTMGG